jgi:hypothetical protein
MSEFHTRRPRRRRARVSHANASIHRPPIGRLDEQTTDGLAADDATRARRRDPPRARTRNLSEFRSLITRFFKRVTTSDATVRSSEKRNFERV